MIYHVFTMYYSRFLVGKNYSKHFLLKKIHECVRSKIINCEKLSDFLQIKKMRWLNHEDDALAVSRG